MTDLAGLEGVLRRGIKNPGWVEAGWSKPTGAALDEVVETLKALKLTLRNVPQARRRRLAPACSPASRRSSAC